MPLRAKKTALAAAISNALLATTAHSLQIEEITVTATKREADRQEVAMAISTLSGQDIASLGIENIQDIAKAVPGLTIRDVGMDPTLIIRGAGSAGTSDLAVPIYNDGLYRPLPSQGLASFVDIQRIEVLRGPQGTLFGRNTLGGLVNVVTNKPSSEDFDYGLGLTVGDYSHSKIEGFFNVPVSDKIAARVSLSDTSHDPYVENIFDAEGGLKDADTRYLRAQLQFDISDSINLNLTASTWKDTANGAGDFGHKPLGIPINLATGSTNGFSGSIHPRVGIMDGFEGGKTYNGVFPTDDSASVTSDNRTIAVDYRANRRLEEDSFTMALKWDLGTVSLNLNAGTFDYDGYNLMDGDQSVGGTYAVDGHPGYASGEQQASDSSQVDLNISSTGEGPLKWTLGYYTFSEDALYRFIWGSTSQASPQSVAWASWLHGSQTTNDSSAFYGQAEYDITDAATLTLGARQSDDERTSQSLQPDGPSDSDLPGYTTTTAQQQIGDDSQFDYRLALQYDITDEIMLFGSLSTGYISGAVQETTGNLLDASENKAVEVGLKGTFLDGAMLLNATYYSSEYKGLTTSRTVLNDNNVFISETVPGGGIDASGLELEMIWQVADNLMVASSLVFDASEYSTFEDEYKYTETDGNSRITVIENGSKMMNLSGMDTPFSPDMSGTLSVTYSADLGDLGTLEPSAFIHYSDSYDAFRGMTYFWAQQDSYVTADINVMYRPSNSKFSFQAYILNATDEDYLTGGDAFSGERAIVQFNDPRTIGIKASFNF